MARGALERIGWRVSVFMAAVGLGLAAYRPLLRLPMVNSDNLRIIHRSLGARWSDLLLGRIDWDVNFTGREFRPFPVALYRMDRIFVTPLGPGHRIFALLWAALVAVAAFWVVENVAGGLSRFEAALTAVLCASLPATLAGSEPAGLPTITYMSFAALALVILVGALVTLLPAFAPGGATPSPGRRRAGLALIAFCTLLAGACVEFAPIQAALLVALFGGLTWWHCSGGRRVVLDVAVVALSALVVFYAYKAASGGTSQLFLPGKKYGISGVSWGIGPLDRLFASLAAHLGHATVYGPTNALRNVISTVFPMFGEYGGFTSRRLPFLLPHLCLAGVVLFGLVRFRGRIRLVVFTLAIAAAIVSGSVYTAHRPRWIFPGLVLWAITLVVAVIFWLRDRERSPGVAVRGALVACVIGLVLVNAALAHHAALQLAEFDYAALYSDRPLDKPVYTRVLDSLRVRYRCRLLPQYEAFSHHHGLGERAADRIYALPVSRSSLPGDAQVRTIASGCRGRQ